MRCLVNSSRANGSCAMHVEGVYVTDDRCYSESIVFLSFSTIYNSCTFCVPMKVITISSTSTRGLVFALFPAAGLYTCDASSRQRSH